MLCHVLVRLRQYYMCVSRSLNDLIIKIHLLFLALSCQTFDTTSKPLSKLINILPDIFMVIN